MLFVPYASLSRLARDLYDENRQHVPGLDRPRRHSHSKTFSWARRRALVGVGRRLEGSRQGESGRGAVLRVSGVSGTGRPPRGEEVGDVALDGAQAAMATERTLAPNGS